MSYRGSRIDSKKNACAENNTQKKMCDNKYTIISKTYNDAAHILYEKPNILFFKMYNGTVLVFLLFFIFTNVA